MGYAAMLVGEDFSQQKSKDQPNYQMVTLVLQIPCEDRCLDPQTPPEKAFRGSKHLLRRYLEDFGRLG